MNGFCRVCYKDGIYSYYIGHFLNNKKHGKGKLVYADGKIEEGEFKDDKFIK